tara:strand:- start:164 stop:307 length:144 start_codon:yes stop_codon:yes gene_type:complete
MNKGKMNKGKWSKHEILLSKSVMKAVVVGLVDVEDDVDQRAITSQET